MAMGVTSLLCRPVPAATYNDSQPKLPQQSRPQCRALFSNQVVHHSTFSPSRHLSSPQRASTPRPEKKLLGSSRRLPVVAESANGSPDSGKAQKRTLANDVKGLREKANEYLEQKSGYFWLAGPVLATFAAFLPPVLVNLTELLQRNYLAGLVSTFLVDVVFVLAADLFFVLADKSGHHQTIAGGTPPWIGPWESMGYPKGEPLLTKLVAYAGVAIGMLGVVLSLFIGKLAVGLPAFGSYLALIFVQVAYERLLSNDKVPSYPLVPIVYTVYRYKQLARAMELVAVMGGGVPLAFIIRWLTVVWTFYLAMQLTQLPWLYSRWNTAI